MLIPLLLRAFRGTHLRRLSIAPRLYNLSKYPSFIHEELKDVPRSKQTKSLPKARKRILILSPEETKDKKFSRYLKDVNKKARRASSKPVLKLIDDDSVHSIGSSTTSSSRTPSGNSKVGNTQRGKKSSAAAGRKKQRPSERGKKKMMPFIFRQVTAPSATHKAISPTYEEWRGNKEK